MCVFGFACFRKKFSTCYKCHLLKGTGIYVIPDFPEHVHVQCVLYTFCVVGIEECGARGYTAPC